MQTTRPTRPSRQTRGHEDASEKTAKTTTNHAEKVVVVPDPSLMTKIGRTGYSLSEILAEFADNSLDARDREVRVSIVADGRRVLIEDDAKGMTKEQLIHSLTIAHSTKKGALGEYGIGMKAAAVALGNHFVIETKQAGEDHGFRVEWDAEKWAKAGQWAFNLETRKAAKNHHGTSITVTDLNFELKVKRTGTLRQELSRRFGPFLKSGELALSVNGAKCKAPSFELLPQRGLQVRNPTPFDLKTESGHRITGWCGLLANSSQRGFYGFDTFRRGRMITFFDKVGFQAHPMVARIIGEVHLDHVPVTSNKREWVKTDPLYEDAEQTLAKFIQPFLAECRRLSTTAHAVKAIEMTRLQKFRQGLAEAFNGDAMRQFAFRIAGEHGTGTATAEVPIEQRAGRAGESEERERAEPQEEREPQERHPNKVDPERQKSMRIGGRKFDYEHKFGDLGAGGPWMQFEWDEKRRLLMVISNLESPVVKASRDLAVLAFLHVVDAIAQIVAAEVGGGLDRFDEVRQILLREACRKVAED